MPPKPESPAYVIRVLAWSFCIAAVAWAMFMAFTNRPQVLWYGLVVLAAFVLATSIDRLTRKAE